MGIDQVIAAQDANEADARNGRVTFAEFAARRSQLAAQASHAMATICARIAATSYLQQQNARP